ncbi:MAG: HisA/HisF-related TIM barrel protein [Hyphomicrobiaceae bacterium]
MQLIPVIDIRGGLAVHARAGNREAYQPLETPYAGNADPVEVAVGLTKAFGNKTLYVADLDSIEGGSANVNICRRIVETLPGVEVWLDNGQQRLDHAGLGGAENVSHVLGTESLPDVMSYQTAALESAVAPILSLDYSAEGFIGPKKLLEASQLWPRDVIVMTLARVGMGDGPDLVRLNHIASVAGPNRRVFAAGGVRDLDDLSAVEKAGAHGVLVATALHSRKIKPDDLNEVPGF